MNKRFKLSSLPGIRMAEVTWPAVEQAFKQQPFAVLAVGAAAKEHGPHLPMNTDYLQAEWLVSRLLRLRSIVAWPTLGYGYYPAFVNYPGSVCVDRKVFADTVAAILNSMTAAGATRILVLNTGISTIAPLEEVASHFHAPVRLQIAHIYHGPRYLATVGRLSEQTRGSHADELETSIMLAIDPDRVNINLAVTETRPLQAGVFNRDKPEAANYSPSGVYGDATLATREKGRRLLAAILADIRAQLQTLSARSSRQ